MNNRLTQGWSPERSSWVVDASNSDVILLDNLVVLIIDEFDHLICMDD